MYVFHCPIQSHPSSISRIWVKQDFPVSFIASIAIDKRSRLIIKALHLPSWLNSLPQSTMTFFSVRFHTFLIMPKPTNAKHIIPYIYIYSFRVFFWNRQLLSSKICLLPHHQVKAQGWHLTKSLISSFFLYVFFPFIIITPTVKISSHSYILNLNPQVSYCFFSYNIYRETTMSRLSHA